ncbi:hypothetical protein PFICI_13342 [Pestalotiopsis fici W106-1]|uniref:FHA domain-containing protein n=1 Tax=Pestalotiopsis fici (strain W106-1 / CGMCC3.15140) TaxID=1229662 RepID=W3WLW7_PESFW|nr:uncharacterized protein PFICI_13342 [Pestalotiopsis fici W106-1]ETS74858.1 hypothetical protein PFICI_13342 [Pestalotiopsis fici W106-1]
MWVLEHEGDALQGKRLWLRPGKRYLFGRTIAEPGMLAIHGHKATSVSRKHVTIEVDAVRKGDSQNLSTRSKVTVEDLGSKLGTTVNENKIKGEKYVVDQEENDLKLGNMSGFKITWFPVVLSFSFSARELEAGAQTRLQSNFEQLDVKLLAEIDSKFTTHVVNKKRNTAKGLQALINGTYLVDDGFMNALLEATRADDLGGGVTRSALEADFDAHWPDAMDFLPAPGNEPVQRPAEAFAPNPERREIFDGYTFIFYDSKQHNSLIGPITDGKGKALWREVVPNETQIDDFIRYVKSVAGEKGLGEFEDGSEGKGVVVVRYVPAEPAWYQEFYTAVSLRLDHRLIDQKDFLDAILACDASGLRRPLEVETPGPTQNEPNVPEQPMDVDIEQPPASPAPRVMTRRPALTTRKKFKGFVSDSDSDGDSKADVLAEEVLTAPSQPPDAVESSQEGLFVSQEVDSQEPEAVVETAQRSQRKRPAPRSLDEDFAPTAAQLKRRRLELGQDPIPRQSTPETSAQPETDLETTKGRKGTKAKDVKVKKEFDVLEIAGRNREEAEAKARAERDELEANAEDLDLAEIGRLQIVETMELRRDLGPTRTRDQDIADGRWNPAWNGRKNFKKFRQRGAVEAARPPQRIIIELEEAKSNTGGIGDDYWLEDEATQKRKRNTQRESQSQASGILSTNKSTRQSRKSASVQNGEGESDAGNTLMEDLDASNQTENVDDDEEPVSSAVRRRGTRDTFTPQESLRSQRTTQRSTIPRGAAKRPAPAPPAKEQPAKRSRRDNIPDSDDDDSEDELRFRFRKR